MKYYNWNFSKSWHTKYCVYHFNFSCNIGDDQWTGMINQYGLGLFFIHYAEHFSVYFHILGIRLRVNFELFKRAYTPTDMLRLHEERQKRG